MDFDFHYAWSILPALLDGVAVTLEATCGGMAIAILGGLTLAIARLSRSPILSAAAISYMEFFRLTPLLVQLFFNPLRAAVIRHPTERVHLRRDRPWTVL